MKTLLVAIQKGGQGKSMVCTSIVFLAEEMGLKVLALDLDGQGTLSKNLCVDVDREKAPTLALFQGQHPTPLSIRTKVVGKGSIGLLTGDQRLVEVDENPKITAESLRTQLAQYSAEGFDVCVIDPPPTLGKRLRAALMVADFVVMPFAPVRESVDGLGDLLETIERVKRESNPSLNILGLVPNKINSRSSAERKTMAELRAAAPELILPLKIHERTSIANAMGGSRPVWQDARGESHRLAAKEVRAACTLILKKVTKK